MRILSANKVDSITLDLDQVGGSIYPDFNLTVEVEDGTFKGVIVTWVAPDDLNGFVRQLEQCERTRRGAATLMGTGEDDFELRVESTDSLGHFAVRYRLTTNNYVLEGGTPRTLYGGFNLDSELFANLVRDFAAFVSSLPSPKRL